jgi:hypothetical protein
MMRGTSSDVTRADRLWGPPSLSSDGYRGLKLTNSSPSSGELKNGGAIPPLPDTTSLRGT